MVQALKDFPQGDAEHHLWYSSNSTAIKVVSLLFEPPTADNDTYLEAAKYILA